MEQQVTISVDKLNALLAEQPAIITDLLLRRVKVPDSWIGSVTRREDGLCSALSLFNNVLLTSPRAVAALVRDMDDVSEGLMGFDLVEDTGKTPGRTWLKDREPCYFMSQKLYNLMWDRVAQYATPDELDEIRDLAAECSDLMPPSVTDVSRS